MPLPNTRVISSRWSEHHRPTATGTMTATCEITRRGTGGTTDADGTYTPGGPSTLYTGPCRVQALASRQEVVVVGEAQETEHRYLVTIEFDAAEVRIGDLVKVTAAKDAGLVGRQLRVSDMAHGSEVWERDLFCKELET